MVLDGAAVGVIEHSSGIEHEAEVGSADADGDRAGGYEFLQVQLIKRAYDDEAVDLGPGVKVGSPTFAPHLHVGVLLPAGDPLGHDVVVGQHWVAPIAASVELSVTVDEFLHGESWRSYSSSDTYGGLGARDGGEGPT